MWRTKLIFETVLVWSDEEANNNKCASILLQMWRTKLNCYRVSLEWRRRENACRSPAGGEMSRPLVWEVDTPASEPGPTVNKYGLWWCSLYLQRLKWWSIYVDIFRESDSRGADKIYYKYIVYYIWFVLLIIRTNIYACVCFSVGQTTSNNQHVVKKKIVTINRSTARFVTYSSSFNFLRYIL